MNLCFRGANLRIVLGCLSKFLPFPSLLLFLTFYLLPIHPCFPITVDIICSDEQFSRLCTMATAAQGVEEDLSNSYMTFFAPTNDAIEKFLATGIDIDPSNDPYFFLDHSVFFSRIKSSDIDCSLSELPPLKMAEGITTVTCDSGSIFIAGGGNTGDLIPKVVDADIQSCNAIIHAIDNVILPILDDESGDESGDEDS